jgi:DNA-binding HxlR family transcriptional regulator
MVILDALGRRWALRVLWELRDGPQTFRALRERCEDVSPAVLNERLAELRELGLVEASEAGYVLSAHGRELEALLLSLDAWARRWARGRG